MQFDQYSPFGLLICKDGVKRRRSTGCSIVPFPSMSPFSVCGWVLQKGNKNKKEYMGFLGHSCFLECHCLLFVFKAACGVHRQHALSGCQQPPHSIVDITHLPLLALSVAELLRIQDAQGFSAPFHLKATCECSSGAAGTGSTRTAPACSLSSFPCYVALLDLLTKHKFKDQIIKNFRMATAEH